MWWKVDEDDKAIVALSKTKKRKPFVMDNTSQTKSSRSEDASTPVKERKQVQMVHELKKRKQLSSGAVILMFLHQNDIKFSPRTPGTKIEDHGAVIEEAAITMPRRGWNPT
jgi:hypothetical protein